MRMKFWDWDPDLGMWSVGWSWFSLHGTTPRNADIWTLDIDLGKYSLWLSSGPHRSIEFLNDGTFVWSKSHVPSDCPCYSCRVHRPPTLKEWEQMVYAMGSGDVPTRKLPPRGCQPSDCCGDEEAHG